MKSQARRVPGRLHKGALASRIDHLAERLGWQGWDYDSALLEVREWVKGDPEAGAVSRELYEREQGHPSSDPRFSTLSVQDLKGRFQARLVCAPNAHILLKIIAEGPHAP